MRDHVNNYFDLFLPLATIGPNATFHDGIVAPAGGGRYVVQK
jgi:hypothetical protein